MPGSSKALLAPLSTYSSPDLMFAVEGGAGCGKTYALMKALDARLLEAPLQEGQRVLALTFMHGAKLRLQERLRIVPGLKGRFECVTIDSFAWRLVRRWRSLLIALGNVPVPQDAYDAQCAQAASLLERPEIAAWIAGSFPIVLVDEAQDLRPERLRMVAAMHQSVALLIAADEFQCLDQNLRPNPFVTWLHEACTPQVLEQPRRTKVRGLLAAAGALRLGQVPQNGGGFKIMSSRGPNMTPSLVANAIGWRRPEDGNVAVITPARSGDFADNVIDRVAQKRSSRGHGPYRFRWEASERDQHALISERLAFEGELGLHETLAFLDGLGANSPIKAAKQWVSFQARAKGTISFRSSDLTAAVERDLKMRRQRGGGREHRFTAMTVQQAKNREFDGVIVLWPFKLGGDDEHKRRLLYNAITRARYWCTVILQGPDLANMPPFA